MAKTSIRHSDHVLNTVQSNQAAALSAVAASWRRSALHHGLDPAESLRGERLGESGMVRLREANGELLSVASPIFDSLFGTLCRAGCGIYLANENGVVIESRCTAGDTALFETLNLVRGACWSEAAEGTNGIGTCLVEARQVAILRHEHFASRNIGVSCMDSPIFDPEGRLVAALDVSTCRSDHGEAMAGVIAALVHCTAQQIERDYFCLRYANARIFFAEADGSAGGPALLAVDRDDLVIGATRAARVRFRLGLQPLMAPRPLADLIGMADRTSFRDGERAVLHQALARSGGNVTAAARRLGIGRATFYRRMERVELACAH
ncbi:helix-turn-helix domain-containing protein [Taklimakanibacter lacteus]|uniref:helix-turn-helix domain-containing protein n=1 Tax=Taklimakanibacter lacteus TaxID=2268456 RepID=UPI000E669775